MPDTPSNLSDRTVDCTIVLVDPSPQSIRLLEIALRRAGYHRIALHGAPDALLDRAGPPPDLVVMDLAAGDPEPILRVRRAIAKRPDEAHEGYLPILAISADATERMRRRCLAAGAIDFLAKPFPLGEAVLRIRNLLETRMLHCRLEARNVSLHELVIERTRELEVARFEVIERLCQAVEFRDDVTGRHTRRVGERSAQLAAACGMPARDVDLIRRAAPLHDIGKIAVRDAVLQKAGPLTHDEFDEMKKHTTVGATILADGGSELMRMAEAIARAHHERWDGTGYPAGLTGAAIPLAARIVAIVDVFDAVTSARPYRPAWPLPRAFDAIRHDAGRHFDPDLVSAFLNVSSDQVPEGLPQALAVFRLPRSVVRNPTRPKQGRRTTRKSTCTGSRAAENG